MPLVRRLLVVLAVAGAGLVPAPAMAAGYCTGSGVNVVVDFGALGGGIQKGCDASGNRNAAKAFVNTGHPLEYASRQPGFVCRVNGVPTSDPCVNTSPSNAYWGLYWSDGKSGWTYSSAGAGSLTVPAGATVAFSWQNGGTADPPGAAPAVPAAPVASPKPTPKPTPTRAPSTATGTTSKATRAPASAAPASASAASVAPSAGASASVATGPASPTAAPSTGATTPSSPSGSPAPEAASEVQSPTVDPAAADTSGGGLPWWVPVLVLVLLAAGGGATWWRRRSSP